MYEKAKTYSYKQVESNQIISMLLNNYREKCCYHTLKQMIKRLYKSIVYVGG